MDRLGLEPSELTPCKGILGALPTAHNLHHTRYDPLREQGELFLRGVSLHAVRQEGDDLYVSWDVAERWDDLVEAGGVLGGTTAYPANERD